jgi:hypothetical protein
MAEKIFTFLIDMISDAIQNYGHMYCFAPIEAWYIGNYCIFEGFIASAVLLVFGRDSDMVSCLIALIGICWGFLFVLLFIWTVLGNIFVIVNVIAGNHCLTAGEYILMVTWFAFVYLLFWAFISALKHFFFNDDKITDIRTQLLSIYDDPSKLADNTPEEFFDKHKTVLESIKLLDAEKKLLEKYFKSQIPDGAQISGECFICFGEF